MTNERTDQREPSRPEDRENDQKREAEDANARERTKDKSPWTREGADAPDAADIANPERQR